MARLVQLPIVQRFMFMGIRTTVPKYRIGIAVVAVDEKDRILMLKHVFHAYTPWGLPGGWLDRGESPQTGALRELREETGLTARLGPVVHVRRETRPVSVNMAFLVCGVNGTIQLSPEILAAEWFALDALPSPLLPFTYDAIHAAMQIRAHRFQPREVEIG